MSEAKEKKETEEQETSKEWDQWLLELKEKAAKRLKIEEPA